MIKQTTCYSCDKPIEPEWLPEGEFIGCDECSSDTDKLSVEKLQERCDRYEKALEDIRTNTPIQELLNLPYGCACHEIASEALEVIGGDDEC